MMRGAARLLAATGLLVSLTAAGGAVPNFRLTPQGESGPVVLALIDLERGYPNGDYYCPPDIDWEKEICVGGDYFIHPGVIVRRYGWSDDADLKWRAGKFKDIGGHAARWAKGGRWVAVIEQTDGDYWYVQWKASVERGLFCMPDAMIEHYGLEAPLEKRRLADGTRCYGV